MTREQHPQNAAPVTYLGIDVGTSATKAVILASDGTVVARSRVPHPAARGAGPGRADPSAWRASITAAVRDLTAYGSEIRACLRRARVRATQARRSATPARQPGRLARQPRRIDRQRGIDRRIRRRRIRLGRAGIHRGRIAQRAPPHHAALRDRAVVRVVARRPLLRDRVETPGQHDEQRGPPTRMEHDPHVPDSYYGPGSRVRPAPDHFYARP